MIEKKVKIFDSKEDADLYAQTLVALGMNLDDFIFIVGGKASESSIEKFVEQNR
jgi:hypothetical protein